MSLHNTGIKILTILITKKMSVFLENVFRDAMILIIMLKNALLWLTNWREIFSIEIQKWKWQLHSYSSTKFFDKEWTAKPPAPAIFQLGRKQFFSVIWGNCCRCSDRFLKLIVYARVVHYSKSKFTISKKYCQKNV